MAIPKSKTSDVPKNVRKKDPKEDLKEKPKKKLLVAAIDFGTTFSGWAFSFDHDYNFDPMKISCKQWCSGKHISMKAPTTVLIKPGGLTLEAFGYEAEDRYAELADEGDHKTYYYFQRFKMMLFDNKNLQRTEELEDDKGKRLPAKRVFAMVIKYLKDDVLEESGKKLAGLLEEDEIQWVLTVPAIWTPPAKQFMRECAVEAGIKSANLLIALEPEAASLYSKHLTIQKKKDGSEEGDMLSSFEPGARYMVVDAGGGTIDIIVHEVCSDGRLQEIYKANGGNWGGTTVDKAFFDFLSSIVGKNVMKIFEDEHKDDFLDLQREFEMKKRCIKPDLKSKVKFKIPVSLSELFKDINSQSVIDRIKKDKTLNGMVNFTADKMMLDCKLLKDLFCFTNDHLVQHLEGILDKNATAGTNTIIMVGGFSESSMVFEAVRSAFPNRNILLPQDAGLSVLKGAVIFGHDRKDISGRVSQYSYGFKMYNFYNPLIHPKEKVLIDDTGVMMVRGCFKKLIEVGEKLSANEISRKETVQPSHGSLFCLQLFASQQANPVFVDEADCFKIAEINVDCKDDEGNVGDAVIQLLFGGTEFEAQAIHETTGKETKVTFSFLD